MSDIHFSCTRCGQSIVCGDDCAGQQVSCPKCQQNIIVPDAAAAPINVADTGRKFLTLAFIAVCASVVIGSFDALLLRDVFRGAVSEYQNRLAKDVESLKNDIVRRVSTGGSFTDDDAANALKDLKAKYNNVPIPLPNNLRRDVAEYLAGVTFAANLAGVICGMIACVRRRGRRATSLVAIGLNIITPLILIIFMFMGIGAVLSSGVNLDDDQVKQLEPAANKLLGR